MMMIGSLAAMIFWHLFMLGTTSRRSSVVVAFGSNTNNHHRSRSFAEDEEVNLQVNALTSHKTVLPLAYASLPLCAYHNDGRSKKRKIWTFLKRTMHGNENLGEMLNGDRIQNSPYELRMKQDMYCEHLCALSAGEPAGLQQQQSRWRSSNRLVNAIRDEYHINWISDDLPAEGKRENGRESAVRYWGGIPIGFVNAQDGRAYVNNHVNIEVKYQPVPSNTGSDRQYYRVVAFQIQPFSIRHDIQQLPYPEYADDPQNASMPKFYNTRHQKILNPIASCDPTMAQRPHTSYSSLKDSGSTLQLASGDVLFTYDVIWIESNTPFTARWDNIYTSMENFSPPRMRWLPIVTSLFYALALSGLVAVMLVRSVRATSCSSINSSAVEQHQPGDEATFSYGDDGDDESLESLHDKGYCLVHVDSFHLQDNRVFLLALLCGTGAQLLACFALTAIAAVLGVLHLPGRGRVVTFALVAFFFCGFVNGFVTMQTMKLFETTTTMTQRHWAPVGLAASLFFPGITFVLFVCQEFIAWMNRSTLVVPFIVILFLLVSWLMILTPLACLGAYLGNDNPVSNAYFSAVALPTSSRTVLLGTANYRSIRNGDSLTMGLCVVFGLVFNVCWVVIGLFWQLRSFLVQKGRWRPEYNVLGAILVGGLVCFGSIIGEAYYVMSSVWIEYHYEAYGFLLLVAVIFFWTCGAVSVLFNYITLTVEASHNWWWQFYCSGAAGIWLVFYSFLYGAQLGLSSLSSVMIYGGFMAWVSLAVFLMSGSVGLLCSYLFVRAIFAIGRSGQTILQMVPQQEQEEDDAQRGIDLTEIAYGTVAAATAAANAVYHHNDRKTKHSPHSHGHPDARTDPSQPSLAAAVEVDNNKYGTFSGLS